MGQGKHYIGHLCLLQCFPQLLVFVLAQWVEIEPNPTDLKMNSEKKKVNHDLYFDGYNILAQMLNRECPAVVRTISGLVE